MHITVRKAEPRDCGEIIYLLTQIAGLHHEARPELFKPGSKKYNGDDLEKILADENRPVFVAAGEEGRVVGYCFCIIYRYENHSVFRDHTALYIDDFCVNENFRGQGIGQKLFARVYEFAKELGVYDIELNVWEFNESALRFYEKCGFKIRSRRMEIVM